MVSQRKISVRKKKKLRNSDTGNNRSSLFSGNDKKKRSCLMCGKMFDSNGPFNRRCPKCNRLVELGKGSGVSMPHVYKVSPKESDEFIKLNDLVYSKE